MKYYLKYKGIDKCCEYILKNQIINKNFKFFRNNKKQKLQEYINGDYGNFYIKISGIWENNTKIGITYKIIEYF